MRIVFSRVAGMWMSVGIERQPIVLVLGFFPFGMSGRVAVVLARRRPS